MLRKKERKMPIYIYENAKGEQIEVFQLINDPHVYFGANGKENDWKRVYTLSQISRSYKIDPFSEKEYVNKTSQSTMKMGDMWDISKELSDIRTQKAGIDPVKLEYYDKYAKIHGGTRHLEDNRPKLPKKYKPKLLNAGKPKKCIVTV